MPRFIPRGAFALPALLIALGTSTAVAPPAQPAHGHRRCSYPACAAGRSR
jgi:hypothetical protein